MIIRERNFGKVNLTLSRNNDFFLINLLKRSFAKSMISDSNLIHAFQNLDYDLILDLIEIYNIEVHPDILKDIKKEFQKNLIKNYHLPLHFIVKRTSENTKLPDVDQQHFEAHEKVTEFFDSNGNEVFTLTAYYNLDWEVRKYIFYLITKSLGKNFSATGCLFNYY